MRIVRTILLLIAPLLLFGPGCKQKSDNPFDKTVGSIKKAADDVAKTAKSDAEKLVAEKKKELEKLQKQLKQEAGEEAKKLQKSIDALQEQIAKLEKDF